MYGKDWCLVPAVIIVGYSVSKTKYSIYNHSLKYNKLFASVYS